MTTIKPRPDAAPRRTGADEVDETEPPKAAPHVHGGEAGLGATVARTTHQVMAARPDIFLKRLAVAARATVWVWERFGQKTVQAQSVTSSKLLLDVAKAALSETKLGGVTVSAMSHSHQVATNLLKASEVGHGTPSPLRTVAASPLGKIIPYLNVLAVPLAATQLYQVENDKAATPFQKNLARTSLALTTIATTASFTSNPVGWGVGVGVGALASISDLLLMATRERVRLLHVYEWGAAKGEALLKSLNEMATPR